MALILPLAERPAPVLGPSPDPLFWTLGISLGISHLSTSACGFPPDLGLIKGITLLG